MTINPSFASAGDEMEKIDIRLSYRIVSLFSEGLYASPNKAVEELVANSFDAGAGRVAVFLSADLRYPRALITAGLADPGSLTPYAVGRIVLWTMRRDLDLSEGLAVARMDGVKRFAIANPDHAPYGRAAREALEHAGLWQAVRPRLVFGENISQTAQFVESGNADAGVVALSLVLSPRLAGVGRFVEIPAEHHQPLEQGAVLTVRGTKNEAARRFLLFLKSKEARAIFDRFGFRLPD